MTNPSFRYAASEPKEGFSYGRIGIYRADCKVNCKCGKTGTALNCEVISVSVVLPGRPMSGCFFPQDNFQSSSQPNRDFPSASVPIRSISSSDSSKSNTLRFSCIRSRCMVFGMTLMPR